MPEEKKGNLKITIEVEINEPLMDAIKESREQLATVVTDLVKQRAS